MTQMKFENKVKKSSSTSIEWNNKKQSLSIWK